MTFIQSQYFEWEEKENAAYKLYTQGCKSVPNEILNALDQNKDGTKNIIEILKNLKNYTSGVIENDNYIVAWVDHIRTWPLFYTMIDENFVISPNAYTLENKINIKSYTQDKLNQFRLSGYVTGEETIHENIKSISPGQLIIWSKKSKTLKKYKYFSYIPTFDRKIEKNEAIEELDEIFDQLILNIIKKADGKQIVLPLSGGLDSRILLCKLHQHGCKNITTFTYGPRFNFEGLIAKKIAKKLNVPWQFITVPKNTAYNYFNDQNRKEFWKFSSNLKSIPCMREYAAIRYINEHNLIDPDAIIINGQSGDYISGGHISDKFLNTEEYNKEDFYNVIINKHYDLWKQFKTDQNLNNVKTDIDLLLSDAGLHYTDIQQKMDGAVFEETWEYEGRQICYVVNGQRIYEFYGYDWEMPLWDKKLVDFYQNSPLNLKQNQSLYKEYLQSYNYKKLFPKKEPYIWRWPLPMLWVVPTAQIIGLIKGRKDKDHFYAKMRYHGHYANQYNFFDTATHNKTCINARSIISLYVPVWFKDHGLDFE